MDNALKILYDEHDTILVGIEIVREAKKLIGKNNEQYESIIKDMIHFFRTYGDQYHHFKEEMILFPAIAKKNDMLKEGILAEMFENHNDFRDILQDIEKDVLNKNYVEASNLMEEYTENLLTHIAVENEEIFLVAYSLLTDMELENIYYSFRDIDRELGDKKKSDFIEFLERMKVNN